MNPEQPTSANLTDPPEDTSSDSLYVDLAFTRDGALRVSAMAYNGEAADPADPKILSPVPMSVMSWAAGVGERFWQQHGRCLALGLLLDPSLTRWSLGMPLQPSGRESVAWSLQGADAILFPPGHKIAGSWQAVVEPTNDEVESILPPFAGIHFVTGILPDSRQRKLWAYLNLGGVARNVEMTSVTIDDTESLIADGKDRITLV